SSTTIQVQGDPGMIWARVLAYVTGTVNQELLLRNEYLAAENRILRAKIKGRLLLSDTEKATLAEIAHRLARKALDDLAAAARPETLLSWYRKLIANKYDGSRNRKSWGRPRIDQETERLVIQMAKDNPGWGYDRIVGAMANLGFQLSDQTVANILRRHNIPPAPKREADHPLERFYPCSHGRIGGDRLFHGGSADPAWLDDLLRAFFIHLESRKVYVAGITRHPDQEWMEQMARNVTMEDAGFLIQKRYLLHDRDSKYCSSFREVIEAGGVKPLALPPRSPNLNAYAERWVRSVKEECLTKLILLGEGSLRLALKHYETHYHQERNHQGKDNRLLFPLRAPAVLGERDNIRCRERLGGLLKYYEAA